MSFASFAWPWFVGGLAVLAAALFALQRLRSRYRDIPVVSSMLWRAVLRDAPARKLLGQFRQPWSYFLILTICASMWFAIARPQLGRTEDGRFHILVLDASARMARGDRYVTALDELRSRVATLPVDRRMILWSGDEVRTLLSPGEDVALLERRVRGLGPQPAPSQLDKLLGELSEVDRGSVQTEVTVFGDSPVRRERLQSLPQGFVVNRAAPLTGMASNAGVTALGFSDAQSSEWDRIDVYVEARHDDGSVVDAKDLQIELDGKSFASTPRSAGRGWIIPDVPAQGGVLTAQIKQRDALALDDIARVRLPERALIRVQLSPSLNGALKSALEADPVVRLTDEAPQVVIRRAGEQIGATLPAMEFVSASAQPAAFLLTFPSSIDGEARFADAVNAIGLTQIDAMSLAQSARAPIAVSMAQGAQWRLSLWSELLTDEYDFTRSRIFPLFVTNAVGWLAGVTSVPPYVIAARPMIEESIDAKGAVLGVPFVPSRAGEVSIGDYARPLMASLLDPAVTVSDDEDAIEVAPRPAATSAAVEEALIPALVVAALLLLALEWYGVRSGRVP